MTDTATDDAPYFPHFAEPAGTADLLAALERHRVTVHARAVAVYDDLDVLVRGTWPVLLLWDVLVGITTGALAHDQDYWWQTREKSRKTGNEPARCGTFRCVAGWIVEVAHPGLHARSPHIVDTAAYYGTRVAMVTYDGRQRWISGLAAELLGVETGYESPDHEPDSPLDALWSGGNTLRNLWEEAEFVTAGAIYLPDELAQAVNDADR